MALFKSKPVSELEKLRAELAKLQERISANQKELAALRNVSDEAILDQLLVNQGLVAVGPELRARDRQRIRELEDIAEDLTRAQRALLVRIRLAQRALQHEQAEKIRAEANTLQAELDAHNAETARLKTALEAHAGEPYFPTPGWDLPFGQKVGDLPLPPATRMRMRIAELLAEAERVENTEPEPESNVVPIVPTAPQPAPVPEIRTSEPVPPMQPPRGWYEAS